MRLMSQAYAPERRQKVIEEARRAEREAMAAYQRAAQNGCGPELLRLADDWRAARDRLAALEQAEIIWTMEPDAPTHCWECRRRFDQHALMCRVSVAAGVACCEDCAPFIDLVGQYHRQAERMVA